MRKVTSFLSVLVLILVLMLPGAAALAEEDENEPSPGIDITAQFTDTDFKAEVYWAIGKAQGSPIYATDVAGIIKLEIAYIGIKSLAGIEYFIGLEKLSCGGNLLTSLDLSKNTALKELNCYDNRLTSLDASKSTKLEYLYCSKNQLTSLDLSNNPALLCLICSYNNMPFLPVGIEDLKWYEFYPQNVNEAIDITRRFSDENFKTAVYEILEKEPGAEIYDVEVAAITELNVSGREIESLAGIKYFTRLEVLDCSQNLLAELDLSNNLALRKLDCSHNRLAQPPAGLELLQLDEYVFEPQDVGKSNLALYLLIGGLALFSLACGATIVWLLSRKKKKAVQTATQSQPAPETAPVPGVAPESASLPELWNKEVTWEPAPEPEQTPESLPEPVSAPESEEISFVPENISEPISEEISFVPENMSEPISEESFTE